MNKFREEIGRLTAKVERYEDFIRQLPCQLPMACSAEHPCLACKLHEEKNNDV